MPRPDNEYAVGDEIPVAVYIERNGAADLLAGDVVTASLITPEGVRATGTSAVTATIIDLASGLVGAVWPFATTGSIVPGRYLAQFVVTRGGAPFTYFSGTFLVRARAS